MTEILKPDEKRAAKKRDMHEAQARTKATELQWEAIEFKIKAFMAAYPQDWQAFCADLNRGQSKYNEAKEGGLKTSQWRNTAAFPVIYRHDMTGELVEVDALKPALEAVIPQLTHKKSVNFHEFLRRFPQFRPSEKSNDGSF